MKRATLLLVLLCGCAGGSDVVRPDGTGDCAGACERLQELGCPAGKGSPGEDEIDGTADDPGCEQTCLDVEAEGIIRLSTECVSQAQDCEAADQCAVDHP